MNSNAEYYFCDAREIIFWWKMLRHLATALFYLSFAILILLPL